MSPSASFIAGGEKPYRRQRDFYLAARNLASGEKYRSCVCFVAGSENYFSLPAIKIETFECLARNPAIKLMTNQAGCSILFIAQFSHAFLHDISLIGLK